ncbi:hypothetical protein KAW50_06035 [candidate division WOR-3 bacterium]|nr:hypothetical protein [candidate division WOR-3 bacterium]
MNLLNKFMNMDRRWIYLITAICVIIPFLIPIGLPTYTTPPVKNLYDKIDSTPEGQIVLLSLDFDAATLPELYPMAVTILNHCFVKDIKVILMSLYMQGIGIAQVCLEDVKREFPDKKEGIDYTFLPFVPGASIVILGIGEDIHKTFPTDYYGTLIDSLPMMRDVRNFDQISVAISLSGSAISRTWITYANQRYGANVAAGVTAVMAAENYPYLQTKQLTGMLGGLKGAAEYENLVEKNLKLETRKAACIGMDAQSAVHIMMIVFIILANIAYFAGRRRKK